MSLFKDAAKGMVWTTASTVVRSVVALLQVAFLTRFLEKSDFGVVAIATLFIGFTQLFMDLGISAGIMHKQDTTPQQYSSLFWLNIIMGIVLTTILCVSSPLIAKAYKEPQLVKVISLLSLTVFFSSLGSQHKTVQQKKMRFKYISIVEIVSSLLSLGIAIYLAMNSFGVYSLVFANLFHAAFAGLLFLGIGLSRDRNISFHFKLSETYEYLKIGVYSIGSNILDYFSRELDIMIISATLGKEIVGVYSLCKRLVMSVYGAINPIFTKVFTPILALIQSEKQRVQKLYNDIVQSLGLLNMPIYCLIAIFSMGILNFLYGEQYQDGALVLAFLSLTYGVNTTGNPVGSLQVAMGRTDLGLYWTMVRIVATVLAIYLGTLFGGVDGIAFSLLLLSCFVNPLFWIISIRPITKGEYIDYFASSLLVCLEVMVYSIPFFILFRNISLVWACLLIGFVYICIYAILISRLYSKSYLVRTLRDVLIPGLISEVHFKRHA